MVSAGYEVMPAYGNSGINQEVNISSGGDVDSSQGTSGSSGGINNTESLALSETGPHTIEDSMGVASSENMDEGGGDFSGVMLAEVESNTNEWQIISPGGAGGGGVSNAGR